MILNENVNYSFQPHSTTTKKMSAGDSKKNFQAEVKTTKKLLVPKMNGPGSHESPKKSRYNTSYLQCCMQQVLPITFLPYIKSFLHKGGKYAIRGFFLRLMLTIFVKKISVIHRFLVLLNTHSSLPEQLLSVLYFNICQLDSCVEGFPNTFPLHPLQPFLFCMWWLPNIYFPVFLFNLSI